MSPFEVTAQSNGYFQSNTMSGTRLNSKIEDLGQSISVMTKAQMQDFAMLDINDVFDYMAGTEGTDTYSDIQVDRTGAVTDNVALNPTEANRVRGISSANVAFDNFETTRRIPLDPLWLDSVELSRGPNANIFGLGNAGGTVNQVAAKANLTRDINRVEGRVDSYGGWRVSLDVSRVLIKNKLALRASYANDHTAFVRKPSGESARRLSLQLQAQPFKKTTISIGWYNYTDAAQRPNFTTPRDNITGWIQAGRPSWNPVTRLITVNGVSFGQAADKVSLAAGSTTPITNLPSYFNGSPSEGRSIFRIGSGGESPYWTTPSATDPANPFGGTPKNSPYLVSTSAVDSYGATQPLFATYAALADKSVYNWDKVNLMANNKQWDKDNMYLTELTQNFFRTSRQSLDAQFAWLREDDRRLANLPMGPASVNGIVGEIYADPNIVNLDGSPNPYYGRPYLRSKEPFLRDQPVIWDTYRAQAAYQLNFTEDKGWTKWLGQHQLMGYDEYKNRRSWQYVWRHTSTSYDAPYYQYDLAEGRPLANRTTSGNQYGVPVQAAGSSKGTNYPRVYEFYYVGNTPDAGVQYGPNNFPEGATVPFVWGNTGAFHYDPTTIGWTPSPDSSAGQSDKQEVIKTYGGTLQSHWLDDMLVTTVGLREDKVYDRYGHLAVLTPDLLHFNFPASSGWQDGSQWRFASGKTKTYQFVARPFKDIGFLRRAEEHGSGVGSFLAEIVRSFSPFYNKSDSFIPEGPAVDLFLKPLPNQLGKGKDIGFWVTAFHQRLSIRFTHYVDKDIADRKGDISTIAQRVLRFDGLLANDGYSLYNRSTDWITQLHPDYTPDQVAAARAQVMGLSVNQITALQNAASSGALAATQDTVGSGNELEINFNPTADWTVKASATDSKTIYQNSGSTIEDWINQRMPVWMKIEDPRFTAADAPGLPVGPTGHLLWWYIWGTGPLNTDYHYSNKFTGSAAGYWPTFVAGPLAVYRQLEGRPTPQNSQYAVRLSTRYRLAGITENRILKNVAVGGAWRWDSKRAIGYYGLQSLPNEITQLDPNRPYYTPAQTHIDLFTSYETRMFHNRVRARFQLNVQNVTEPGGGLLPIQVFPDGTPLAYRIVDPRKFILSASFDM